MTKLGIRYYDPTLGRFTQLDTTSQDPHYTYAANSPVNFIDPTGGSCASALGGLALGVVGYAASGAAIFTGAGAALGAVGAATSLGGIVLSANDLKDQGCVD